jgi:hypothetical protein
MNVKPDFLRYRSFQLHNGRKIRFCEDKWLGNYSFQQQYPSMYNLVRRKSDTVANVFNIIPSNVSFCRYLTGNNLALWNNLVQRIVHIQLTDDEDVLKWNFQQSGQFSVHSMYLELINNGFVDTNKRMWKVRIPLKIKIFMWYMYKGIVLTKDNLARHSWDGNKQCNFCCKDETIRHLFFNCYYARFLWGLTHITFGIPPTLLICLVLGQTL